MKKVITIALTIAFAVATALNWPHPSGELEITMLDIGQGDAIHIRTPSGHDILVDGGPDRTVVHELGQSMPPHDHTLELVIGTHPDADHIGGIPEVAQVYEIDTLLTNGVPKDTGFARAVDQLNPQPATQGQIIEFDDGVALEVLHPNPAALHGDEYNEDSVVFILSYGDFRALFTGDIGVDVERELAQEYGENLDVDLLKIPHHGSKTSTSQELLDATTPEIALISVGRDNRFGHPHAGPLYRLQQSNIPTLRTDQNGRIFCTSDGVGHECVTTR